MGYPARLLCFALTLFACVVHAQPVAEAPKLTSRPQGAGNGLALTTLDEKSVWALSQSVIGKPIDDFVLLDRQGRPTSLTAYRGKPLLVHFIYTGCFEVCPTSTRSLHRVVEEVVSVLGPSRFNVVSIGFNQPFDSPSALKTFAYQAGIRMPNWEFLSPAAAIVPELTRNFGFSYVATAAGFDHLNQVTIVDADGRIVRQVYGETFTPADIAEPLKTLIAGAPLPAQTNTLVELVDRIRILCSVYDPVTGKYRTNYALYLEIAGFISFVGFLIYLGTGFMRGHRDAKRHPG